MPSRKLAAIVFAGLACVALIGSTPSATRPVLTAPVKDRISLGDVHLYFLIAVFDPNVAEILTGHLTAGVRPAMDLKVDPIITNSPRVDHHCTSFTERYYLTAAQLSAVEDGVRRLGFAESAVHGWLVTTNENAGGPTRLGEILLIFLIASPRGERYDALYYRSLGSYGTTGAASARSRRSGTWSFLPSGLSRGCTKRRIEFEPARSLRGRAPSLKMRSAITCDSLLLRSTIPTICSAHVHPVNIANTYDWTVMSRRFDFDNHRDLVVSGTARYDMGMALPSRPISALSVAPIEGTIPNSNWSPTSLRSFPKADIALRAQT